MFAGLIFFFMQHLFTCAFIMLGQFQDSRSKWFQPTL